MTLLDRMVLGVERVRDRLKRASAALEAAGILYAVNGGNAVAKDEVHLSDMLEIGLVDASWVLRLPQSLGARLQQLIDTPEQ